MGAPFSGLRVMLIGDSIMGLGNYSPTAGLAMSVNGTQVTVTMNSHGMYPGAAFCVGNVTPDEYNGFFSVESYIDANTFTYRLPAAPSALPNTASLRITTQYRINDRNWPQYANASMGNPWFIVGNAGIGGDTVGNCYVRLRRDALDYGIQAFIWNCGINDVYADRTADYIVEYTLRAIQDGIAAGVVPIICTLPPVDTGYVNYSAARRAVAYTVNNWIRNYCASAQNVKCFDFNAAVSDPLTGNYIANASADALHPSGYGAQLAGAAMAALFSSGVTPASPIAVNIIDVYGTDPSSVQLNDNPLMQGTNGTANGSITTGGSGTGVPTGYTLTETGAGSCVADVVARADGIGNDLRMVMTAVNADDRLILTRSSQFSARAALGLRYQFEVNVRATGLVNFSYLSCNVNFTVDGVTYTVSWPNTGGGASWGNEFNVWLRSPVIVLPGLPTSMNIQCAPRWAGAGGGTVYVGRYSFFSWPE